MMRGLWRLAWLEVKIFLREPLGVFGTALPVLIFVVFGRLFGRQMRSASAGVPRALSVDLPIFTSLLIGVSAVSSLVAIIAIYRESGILKRLRATPLRPLTILTAHVTVKLLFTAVTLAAMMLAGRRYFPMDADIPIMSFSLALLFSTVCILSLGFLIASVVPTARFAQPIGSFILYPMLAVSGLFVPLPSLPPTLRAVAGALPITYAVSLLRGIWRGEGWAAHASDVAVLALMFLLFSAVSAKVFRWE
jgi:ABC-2 type transport system permease protein